MFIDGFGTENDLSRKTFHVHNMEFGGENLSKPFHFPAQDYRPYRAECFAIKISADCLVLQSYSVHYAKIDCHLSCYEIVRFATGVEFHFEWEMVFDFRTPYLCRPEKGVSTFLGVSVTMKVNFAEEYIAYLVLEEPLDLL
jgi:hypothetical protein